MNQPYNPNQQYQQQPQGGGFGFDLNQYEPSASFENLPIGWYNVVVTKAEIEDTQGTGKKLAVQYTVYGGTFNGRVLFDNLNIFNDNEQAQEIARRNLRAMQDAIQKAVNSPLDLLNNYMCVKVGLDKPKKTATEAEKAAHDPRNIIRGWKPFDQNLAATNSQAPAQQYSVQVQPQGGGVPNFTAQQPQYSPPQQPMHQPQYQQQAPQQQAPQQMPPQQQQYQQAPQQTPVQPQPQYQQQPTQPGADQYQGNSGQPGQAQPAPAATAPAGQPTPPLAAPSADFQAAPPPSFAPQQNQPPAGNVPPPQQQAPQQQPPQQQQAPSQQGNMPPPGNTPPPAQQQQQYAPPPGNQPPQAGNTPPPPGAAW